MRLAHLIPLSILLAPALASADPDRLNHPDPPAPVAPPPTYNAPPPVTGYNAPPPVTGYNAPPPVYQAQRPYNPPPMYRPAVVAPPPPPAAHQGFFVGLQGGAAIPVTGDYGESLSTGFMGLGHLGWATPSGVSVRAELGVRSNAFADTTFASSPVTSIFYGGVLRYTLQAPRFRPYGEVMVDAFNTLATTSTVDSGAGTITTSTDSGTGVSVGLALGADIVVNSSFSLELAVRYDQIVSASTDVKGGLLGVLGGGTFYF